MKEIYLDNNATTPLDPKVVSSMQSAYAIYGNPSSTHSQGKKAKQLLVSSRARIAKYLNVQDRTIHFTSGGTESINLLLRSIKHPRHIITSNTEHASIFHTLQDLSLSSITYVPSGLEGAPKSQDIQAALRPETDLIVLAAVNSETGAMIDLEAIATIAKQNNIPFVVDAIALLGKEPITLFEGISAMAFSGHKIHGPKGTGCIYAHETFPLSPQLTGGGQERGYRSGTENLMGIIGFAEAVALLETELPKASLQMRALKENLEKGIQALYPTAQINALGPRICNTSNIHFPGVDAETLFIQLDLAGIAVSLGSACASGGLEPSRILLNMGLSHSAARSSIRFSLSRLTTQEDITYCLTHLAKLLPFFEAKIS